MLGEPCCPTTHPRSPPPSHGKGTFCFHIGPALPRGATLLHLDLPARGANPLPRSQAALSGRNRCAPLGCMGPSCLDPEQAGGWRGPKSRAKPQTFARACGRSSHLLPVGAGQEPALPSAALFSNARLDRVSPACLLPSPKRSPVLPAEQQIEDAAVPPTWSPSSSGLGRAGTEDPAVISLQMLFA